MPRYSKIDPRDSDGSRAIEGLLRLRSKLAQEIPPKKLDETLLLATWNIREMGGTKYGGREQEPLFYIAEIISRFDLVAIQEVRSDLGQFEALIGILGKWWKYLVSDVSAGRQGNDERVAFLYDSRKVTFGGLVGELVPEMVKDENTGTLKANFAYARSPFLAGFQCGWFKFTICSDHLYYGESKPDDPQRLAETTAITKQLVVRSKHNDTWAKSIVLLGDFNVFSVNDKSFKAIEEGMFRVPAEIRNTYTNANRDKPFDQIGFYEGSSVDKIRVLKAGSFDFYDCVYRKNDGEKYASTDFLQYRTYKMSDHLPLWVEIDTNFGTEYLLKKQKEFASNI